FFCRTGRGRAAEKASACGGHGEDAREGSDVRGAASQKPHRADSHIDDGLAQENDAFAAALRKADDAHVTTRHFATDHACSDKRIELSQTALEWLAGLPNQVLGARWERRGVQVIARQ